MKTVLITGAGRRTGLGFETARQLGRKGWHVILAARKQDQLDSLVKELRDGGANASSVVMDLMNDASVAAAAKQIGQAFGVLDVLINNAAVMTAGATIEEQDLDELRKTFETNVIGTWSVIQTFIPLLKKSQHPRIVNVSSGAGSFEDPQYGLLHGTVVTNPMGYGISKLAVNGITIKAAKELKPFGILVNSVCPDVTDTWGMGFGRNVLDSAKSVVWGAELPDDGPTGSFFRDGKKLPW